MIRVIRLYLLSMIVILNASNIEQEIGINIGLNSTKNEEGNKFKNPNLGFTYQDNKYIVAPRLDIDYTKVKDDYANSLVKVSLNGVYEYANNTATTPYALAGLGYEFVSGGTDEVFESNAFVQAGGGLMFNLNQGIKARVEAKALKILGGKNQDNEFIGTAGISMPIFSKKRHTKPFVSKVIAPMPIPIEPILIASPIVEPALVYTSNNNECSIKINAPDLDRDGVSDNMDQCPATPCSFSVDQYGCPIKTTLKINFATNSADVRDDSIFRITKFADFLLANKGSTVKIIGHTDSVGSASHNLSLSMRRANRVLNELVNRGVSSSRLEAVGLGESMPIASNETVSGKARNRRIEAELSYAQGRR